MKKIIIIKDTIDQYEDFNKKFLNEDLVEVSKDIEPIYDNIKKQFLNDDLYDFVIIHKNFSQSGVNSEFISDLQRFVNEKMPYRIIIYSGENKVTAPINSLNQIHFYLKRSVVNENILDFVSFSKLIGKWYIPALLSKDYKRRFLKASFNQLSKNFDNELALKCLRVIGYEDVKITDENRLAILERLNKEIYE